MSALTTPMRTAHDVSGWVTLWRQAEIPVLRETAEQIEESRAREDEVDVDLVDVQQTLMRGWRLPELLVRISNDHHDAAPQVRNVVLAIRLARHTKDGWDNAAIPDDVRDISQLLNLRPASTLKLLHDLDS